MPCLPRFLPLACVLCLMYCSRSSNSRSSSSTIPLLFLHLYVFLSRLLTWIYAYSTLATEPFVYNKGPRFVYSNIIIGILPLIAGLHEFCKLFGSGPSFKSRSLPSVKIIFSRRLCQLQRHFLGSVGRNVNLTRCAMHYLSHRLARRSARASSLLRQWNKPLALVHRPLQA